MRKACLVVQPVYRNNEIFNKESWLNRDNCLANYRALKRHFNLRGIDLATQDINSIEESDFVIYNDMPKKLPSDNKSYLILYESEVIRPDNWDRSKHKSFQKIFTWNDDWVDNKKYLKSNFTVSPESYEKYFHKMPRNKLCTLIAGNKRSNHPKELYSQRLKAIEWFERNASDDFDFYGMGWEQYSFQGLLKKLNRFSFLRKLIPIRRYKTYKGKVESKAETLSKYKFCVCYENAKDIPGYITEKIFDCFFAGTIPLYWGPPNISSFIPPACFIDRTKFRDIGEAYAFLKGLGEADLERIRSNIKQFLDGDKIKQFYVEQFATNIVKAILNE